MSDIMMQENKMEQRASNRGGNSNSERDNNEGYEEFLALLASPSPSPSPSTHKEMPAATPSLASSSTSTVALSVSEQGDVPRCLSLARCSVDIDFDTATPQEDGPYLPPSAQAPDNRNAGHATSDDGQSLVEERKIVTIKNQPLGMPLKHLKSSMPRSSSCPDISEMRMGKKLTPPGTGGSLSMETKKIKDHTLPTFNPSKSSRSIVLKSSSSRRSNTSSQTWHPHASSHNIGVNLEKNGMKVNDVSSTPTNIAPCANDNNDAVKPRIRGGKSRRSNNLSQSWHPMSTTPSMRKDLLQAEHPKLEKIKERPNLKKQASSILGKRRPSRQSLRLGNELDSAQIDQLQIIDEKTDPFLKNLHWWHAVFFFGTISLLACLLQVLLPPPYGLMMTSAEVAEVGVAPGCEDELEHCICPRETICATNTLSMILLALARSSAFFDYPLYMMLFLSKAHNLNNHFRRTLLREWIDFGDMHKVHKIFGIVVGIETMSHSFFHLLRWGLNNELSLLWQSAAGVTGFIAAAVTPLICWPMAVPFLKQRMRFEVRKGLHYLSIVWAIALLFHAPSRIPWLIGIAAAVYVADYIFGYAKKNNLIETAYFERYGESGVALHFKNPKSWEDRSPTSYVLIMCPWISKYQWHAFTMFPDPTKENHSMLCINSGGDWTKQLYDKIKAPCMRQLYVHGPFMTEFSDTAVSTSNAIAVASGIGITPTLSLMMNYAGRKRINIIWGCRDPGLIEFILHKVDISTITKNSFAFIFYTGKRELALPKNIPANVFIIRSRPNLEETITGIITAIHSGEGLPEELYEKQKKIANAPFSKRMMIAMARVRNIYDEDDMFAYAVKETEIAAQRMQAMDLEFGHMTSSLDEVPKGHVSLSGLDAMISRFLGVIGEYSRSDIEDIFDTIDTDSSGFIDREEFSAFLRLATCATVTDTRSSTELLSTMVGLTDMEAALSTSMHNLSHHFTTNQSQSHGSMFGGSNTVEYMDKLMNASTSSDSDEKPLEEWSMFYCGGSNAIVKDLKEISKRYDIDLAVEKFDW